MENYIAINVILIYIITLYNFKKFAIISLMVNA